MWEGWEGLELDISARTFPAPGNIPVPLEGATSPAKGCAGPGPITEQAVQSHPLQNNPLSLPALPVPSPAPLARSEHIPDKHNHSCLSLLPPPFHSPSSNQARGFPKTVKFLRNSQTTWAAEPAQSPSGSASTSPISRVFPGITQPPRNKINIQGAA